MPQTAPLRVLLICPDPAIRMELMSAFAQLGSDVAVAQAIPGYPSGTELARFLRTLSPQVVLLSFERPDTAQMVLRFLESEADGLPIVAVHRKDALELLRAAMHAGVREYLSAPFDAGHLQETLQTVRGLLRRAPPAYTATDHIYSFLPAKPGAGTTTVALNTSAALARESNTKVLLADLDLTCGILRFLLKLPQDLSIVDALSRAAEMDVSLWPQVVSTRDGIDILHSGSINPQALLEPVQVQGLIDFARSTYDALFFDMSGNLERHSIQVMQESKQVFLVVNPELCSLFLGREKIAFLRAAGIEGRISAIVNRSDQALALPRAQIETFLQIPVIAEFGNDTRCVENSIADASSVVGSERGRKSALARQYRDFARLLLKASHAHRLPSAA